MRSLTRVTLALSIITSVVWAQTPGPVPPPEKAISKQQAADLFRSVDELTEFGSKVTGLPVHHTVKRELTSRDQLEKFLMEKMEDDEDTKRLERSEWVIKKFGLLPRDFELRAFIVKLLREQVAGFYDSKKKTVFLLDWLSADVQRPVLAHELAHALQDQNFDLERWMKQARQEAEHHSRRFADAEYDEASGARSAVTEGQAMLVLLEYMLSQNGLTIENSPQFVDAFTAGLDGKSIGPLAATAPLLISESLIFPYRDGVRFTYKVIQAEGKDRAFAGVFRNPPRTTREILSPTSYLSRESLPPLTLPDLSSAFKGKYETYDVGSVGQFDIGVLARQFGDDLLAHRLSPQWRGGIYWAVVPKGKMSTKSTGDIGMVYLSRWSSAKSAAEFAKFYGDTFSRRFGQVTGGPQRWRSGEGDISVDTQGEYVLALESFDADTGAEVRRMILDNLRTGQSSKTTSALRKSTDTYDLGLRVTRPLQGHASLLIADYVDRELTKLVSH